VPVVKILGVLIWKYLQLWSHLEKIRNSLLTTWSTL